VTSVVLDASALLAVMNSEPGADIVRASLVGALMSAVNYSEVMKKTIERSVAVDKLHALIKTASIDIIPFDALLAEASAELYPATKAHGMSFADRACLALGIQRKLLVLTAERKMRIKSLPVTVKLIRNAH
jgi:PIN domain nuclease of toxin-antitoxin system